MYSLRTESDRRVAGWSAGRGAGDEMAPLGWMVAVKVCELYVNESGVEGESLWACSSACKRRIASDAASGGASAGGKYSIAEHGASGADSGGAEGGEVGIEQGGGPDGRGGGETAV